MSVIGIALIVVIALGYLLNWSWTGLGSYTAPKKTLWDWLQLLVIPAVLAIGGFWLNQLQKSREERATERRDKIEHEITLDKQRQDLLQTYLDRMSELLLKEKLRLSAADSEVRNVARVWTITVLTQLDARRIGYVFAFLREAGLMSTTLNDNVVSLNHADLHAVNWSQADLAATNLRGVDLNVADLSGANLREAELSGDDTIVENLKGCYLSRSELSGVNFIGEANLKGATGISIEELEKVAKSLKGATMLDGTMHP